MKVVIVALVTLLMFLTAATSGSFANSSLDDCYKHAMTQSAMDMCASKEARTADSEMATVYAQVLKRASTVPGATAKIRSLQSAWLAYRKSYVRAAFAHSEPNYYGSVLPMQRDQVYAAVTREHIDQLRKLFKLMGPCGAWGPSEYSCTR
jgi:uncharacterized protein YecT (DUF1311 family)